MKKRKSIRVMAFILAIFMIANLGSGVHISYARALIWSQKVEAESGILGGTAIKENIANASGQVVGWIDNGPDNYFLLKVTPDVTGTAKVDFRVRSGEPRRFIYTVNGKEATSDYVNSGSWTTFSAITIDNIDLVGGIENTIKIHAPKGENGPGFDYLNFQIYDGMAAIDRKLLFDKIAEAKNKIEDGNYTSESLVHLEMVVKEAEIVLYEVNATEIQIERETDKLQVAINQLQSDFKEYKLTFQSDEGVELVVVSKLGGEQLEVDEIPVPQKDGYDFLGWFYGPNNKYPLILETYKVENKDQVFTAKWGHHVEGNPVEKQGYRIIFNEDFEGGKNLNSDRWVNKYLSSWSKKPALAQPTYEIKDGVMSLQIKEDTRPWCEEYDGKTIVSGFTTGNRNALHNWNRNNEVRNPVETELTHINKYGFYEIRAKTQPGSSRHAAWWLVGFEDTRKESAEIDIFEVLGKDKHSIPVAFHTWNDSNVFEGGGLTHTDRTKDFHHEWHVYAFEWKQGGGSKNYPDTITLYVDGKEFGSRNVNVEYPMIQLFSLYEKREGGWTGPWEWMPYPNNFDIDYVRVYKEIPEGQPTLNQNEIEITNVSESEIQVQSGKVTLKKYISQVEGHEGETYTEPNLPNTKSYVDVTWNDGIVTQEFVKWDPITEEDLEAINAGESIRKNGELPNLQSEYGNITTTLNIDVVPTPEQPPYTSENLGSRNDETQLAKLFDGNLLDDSGEFIFASSTLPKDKEVNIQYDFKEDVVLDAINVTTNYGKDQGIRKFKVATWNNKEEEWQPQADEYVLNWTEEGKTQKGETIKVKLDQSYGTSKIKIIITDAGLTWGNKLAMRQISFDTIKVEQESFAIADPGMKVYGDDEFTLFTTGGSGTGIVTFESTDENVISIEGTTGTIRNAGEVNITATKQGDGQYNMKTAACTVIVDKKELSFKADDKLNIKIKSEMPKFTYSIVGLVTGDVITNEPTIATTALDTSVVGEYPVTISGGGVSNEQSYKITYKNGKMIIVDQLYIVQVEGGNGKGEYAVGESVTIKANKKDGYTFKNWTSNTSVKFADINSMETNFIMPESNVIVTANYTKDSSNNDNRPSKPSLGIDKEEQLPKEMDKVFQDKLPTIGEVDINIKVDSDNNAIASVDYKEIMNVIQKAKNKNGGNNVDRNGIQVYLNVRADKDIKSLKVSLSKSVQEKLIEEDVSSLTIKSENIEISLNTDALKHIASVTKNDIGVIATSIDVSELSIETQRIVGNRPLFDLKVVSGDNAVASFGEGKILLRIPYTLGDNEKEENVTAVYIDDNGKVNYLSNSSYDSKTNMVLVETNHFSYYGVAYMEDKMLEEFDDIGEHWAKDDIEFMILRGLLRGTDDRKFAPNETMTRGMFVTVLGRLAEVDVRNYDRSSFVDVKEESYYMPYIEWANENNVVRGVGKEIFAPDKPITRQEMAVIITNYTKAISFTLPDTYEERIFADNTEISEWAKKSVKQIQRGGIIVGREGNRFEPQSIATRAEVSVVLKRFINTLAK